MTTIDDMRRRLAEAQEPRASISGFGAANYERVVKDLRRQGHEAHGDDGEQVMVLQLTVATLRENARLRAAIITKLQAICASQDAIISCLRSRAAAQ